MNQSARQMLANVLYVVATIVAGLMIYSMITGPTNYYYGAIALVIALIARAAERLAGKP